MSQSKYDFRSNSEAFKPIRILIPHTEFKTYQEIQDQKECNFMTIYSGIDPIEPSRLLVKSIIKVPVVDPKKQ